MSWTKYPAVCVPHLVVTAAQYSIGNMLYVLFSLTNGRRVLPVEALHSVQHFACYIRHRATFITVAVRYVLRYILVISRMVRLPALLGVLITLNSADRRTTQARINIVRVPAIVRAKSLDTCPHYRGLPTLYRSCSSSSGAVVAVVVLTAVQIAVVAALKSSSGRSSSGGGSESSSSVLAVILAP